MKVYRLLQKHPVVTEKDIIRSFNRKRRDILKLVG